MLAGMVTRALLVAVAMLVTAGCSVLAPLAAAPTPQACGAVFAPQRCELIIDAAAERAGVDRGAVIRIDIVPEPTPQVMPDGTVILQTRGGAAPLVVRVTLADGTTSEMVACGGVSMEPMCTDEPHLRASSVTMGGYRDIPCAGEPPAGCATPHPPPTGDALAAAEPIRIDRVDIPIDRAGQHEVSVGEGSLPNGILTEASFAFLDDWPPGVRIGDGVVHLDVRSLEPDGVPFDSYYSHGWREGVERVEAVLVFDVDHAEPGATLSVSDVVVR